MVCKTIILNELHKILVDTQKLEPVATNTGSVILSQTQIEARVLEVKALIKTMERYLVS
jgi:hypothetical protein